MWIVGGPNGAGKTTFCLRFLPQFAGILSYINSDLIAAGLSPLSPEKASIQSGKIVIQTLNDYAKQRESFAIETTLSTAFHQKFANKLKSRGWNIGLVYLWLYSPQLAMKRVEERVWKGGHSIPKEVILRRYKRGLNLLGAYQSLADRWFIFNNSGEYPKMMAWFDRKSGSSEVLDEDFQKKGKEVGNE